MIFTENHRTEFKEILNDKIEKEIVGVGSSAQQMTTTMIEDLYSKRTRNSLRRMISPRRI